MSLPMLFNGGAECGPSNPLQGLAKRFDQDRGVQQDQFGVSRGASTSRDVFRTQTGPPGPDADAARFFTSPSSSSSSAPSTLGGGTPGLTTAFDVSAMRAALLSPQQQMQPPAAVDNAGWAGDFMNMLASDPGVIVTKQQQTGVVGPVQAQPVNTNVHAGVTQTPQPMMQNWNPMGFGMRGFIPQGLVQYHQQQQQGSSSLNMSDQISWDKEFSAQELQLSTSLADETATATVVQQLPQTQNTEETHHPPQFEGDELARTAGMLIENLKHETNQKFQKSEFMGLMRQLRDGEVIVDGNQMVENQGQARSISKDKGKMREVLPESVTFSPTPWEGQTNIPYDPQEQVEAEQFQKEKEDANDAYFKQENTNYTEYWQDFHEWIAPVSTLTASSQEQEWDTLQADWDQFEATSTGIRQQNNYRFQNNNPYLLGDSSKTRHHALHGGISPALESVLELEAAVQRDMTNARSWYDLGVKQQENEREQKALQALQRAVELDPTHLPSWLALAVSYTNDNNRQGTYDAVEEWVKRNERYASIPYITSDSPNLTMNERYLRLVDHLIAMARSDSGSEIDADTQIALAVLLNTNEDYQKAQDCFRTALAVRPEDWLLYNRVGATLANSGHPEEALQYYYKALELNPGYIRARFNLGISCINLRRYDEAAQYILDALSLQDSDGIKDVAGGRGVTSTALWDSLKTTCLHMQRSDLASICDARDLERFRVRFQE